MQVKQSIQTSHFSMSNHQHHWAVFVSNNAKTHLLTQQILNAKAQAPFDAFNNKKGLLFSSIVLKELIEEEARHEYSDVTKYTNRVLKTLSSGEQKKTLLQHLMAQQPEFIILDNPFDNLDIASQAALRSMLTEAASHITFIQLVQRKADLLPFITNSVYLGEHNVIVDEPEEQDVSVINDSAVTIPPPIHPYTINNKELIQFNNVTVQYNDRTIINNICWTINAGEFWQLIGPNGSGKTTMLTMITGDNPKAYGQNITLFGKRKGSGETVWEIKEKIGYITMAMTDLFSTRHTLQQMIISGFVDSIGLYIKPSDLQIQLANEWLQLLQMQHLGNTPFCNLSVGQQRKALIARAMVKHPPLLILDEPLSGLDDSNAAMVIALINQIAKASSTAIIYVSHRIEEGLSPKSVFQLTATKDGSVGKVV